jgi:glycosyltransferase involved in cell wall biosynthesis
MSAALDPVITAEPPSKTRLKVDLSRYHDIWALVNEENREAIESYIAKNPLPNVHWVFGDLPKSVIGWRKPVQFERVHYYFWQHWMYGLAKRLHEQIGFDATMHLTFGSYWRPSFLRLLPVPFVWGPLGGGENIPQTFYSTLDKETIDWDRRKRFVEWLACTIDPTVRDTAKKSTIALVPTTLTVEKVRALGAKNIVVFGQSGLPVAELEKLRTISIRENPTPIRFISMGRLLGWKGIHLAVRAFAKLLERYPDAEYVHDGGGVLADQITDLAEELGLGHKFRLIEDNTRPQAMDNLAQSDVLLFPNLHNEPGWVCYEAMAAGRPIVYLRGRLPYPGAEETSFISNADTIEDAINDMADAMYQLASDSALRIRMGEAAREHVWKHFNSEARGQYLAQLFEQVARERA